MQYRKAFDAADVDGDNTLEEGEFELVMETLHMGHDLSQAEVGLCFTSPLIVLQFTSN